MLATLTLIASLQLPAQAADQPKTAAPPTIPTSWAIAPKLTRSQEFVYRGQFTEEAAGAVQFTRAYRVESRIFVLDTPVRGAEVAFLTILKPRDTRPTTQGFSTPPPPIAHLARATVDARGRVIPDKNTNLTLPLDGPPINECGAFLEVPSVRVSDGQGWESAEPGRPLHLWRLAGAELINGTSCVKLLGVQQSEDWGQPRADRAAWKRTDTIWLSPRTGLATRVERVIERREPARLQANWRSTLRYDLDSSLQYPAQLFEQRRLEIQQTVAFSQAASPFLAAPTKSNSQLTALAGKITQHLGSQPPTPYREALLQIQRQVEAGRRGESIVPVGADSAVAKPTSGAQPGQLAPDFVVPYLTHSGPSFQLHRWLGRPIVLVFFHPTSRTTPELLRFSQDLVKRHGDDVRVFGLSIDADAARVRSQWNELSLSFPIVSGSGLRKSYSVETTPKVMVLDATGVVKGAYLGWGRETPGEVTRDVRECLKAK